MRIPGIVLTFVLIFAPQIGRAATPVYRVEAIAAGGDGAAFAVNAPGDVAGQLNGKAFVWHNGRLRTFDAMRKYPNTYATAIAEDGTIVGYSGTQSGRKWTRVGGESHAWMWYDGRMTDIGVWIAESSYAYGVNDRGVIVGCAGDRAVRWVNKKIQNLDALIDQHSGWHLKCAYAVNRGYRSDSFHVERN